MFSVNFLGLPIFAWGGLILLVILSLQVASGLRWIKWPAKYHKMLGIGLFIFALFHVMVGLAYFLK